MHWRTQAAHLQQSDVLLSHAGAVSKGEREMIDSLRRVLQYAIEFLEILPGTNVLPLGLDWRLLKWQRPEVMP